MKGYEKSILILLALFMLCMFTWACQSDEPKKMYTYHVTLTHPDGTVQNWILQKYEIDEGFIKWTTKNGGTMSISGSIVINPVVYEPPKPVPDPDPKTEFRDGDMPQ